MASAPHWSWINLYSSPVEQTSNQTNKTNANQISAENRQRNHVHMVEMITEKKKNACISGINHTQAHIGQQIFHRLFFILLSLIKIPCYLFYFSMRLILLLFRIVHTHAHTDTHRHRYTHVWSRFDLQPCTLFTMLENSKLLLLSFHILWPSSSQSKWDDGMMASTQRITNNHISQCWTPYHTIPCHAMLDAFALLVLMFLLFGHHFML